MAVVAARHLVHTLAHRFNAHDALVEWVTRLQWGSDDVCPVCCRINPKTHNAKRIDPDDLGHAPGCEIAGFLASLDAAETEPTP